MNAPCLLEEIADGVAVFTFNRPEKRNAFNGELYDALRQALEATLKDERVGAVVVTGAPGAFTAGQDLSEFGGDAAQSSGQAFPRFMETLCAFDKPLLAAVNGVGVGLGATLPLHCDVVYLAESARLRFPFAALGVVPEAGSSLLLPMIVGPQRAAELLFTAEWIDAHQALELGLATRVLPDAELLEATRARARAIATHPVGGLRAIKRTLLAARADALRAAQEREMAGMLEQVGSPENQAALRAFFSGDRPA